MSGSILMNEISKENRVIINQTIEIERLRSELALANETISVINETLEKIVLPSIKNINTVISVYERNRRV